MMRLRMLCFVLASFSLGLSVSAQSGSFGTNTDIPEQARPPSSHVDASYIPAGMTHIPGGSFVMGCDCCSHDAVPKRRVTVSGFLMDKHEVTVEDFSRYCREKAGLCLSVSMYKARPNYPMAFVTWHEADAYCTWAGKRLPTEAEWEYVASIGRPTATLVVGREFDSLGGNFLGRSDGFAGPSPVGSFEPNDIGVYDLYGNVREWCSDWYDARYYSASGNAIDPEGPQGGQHRVVRGGNWLTPGELSSICHRNHSHPDTRELTVGFRCAKSLQE